MTNDHFDFITDSEIAEMVERELGVIPISVSRQLLTFSGNAIYRVQLSNGTRLVVRVSPKAGVFLYTKSNLDQLRQLGLPVQNVLARGATQRGGSCVILNWLDGRDLMYELSAMTSEQMTRIAERIVEIQRQVGTLPRSSGFGWAPIGKNAPSPKWIDIFGGPDRADAPPAVTPLDQLRARLRTLRKEVEPYFQALVPTCFLDDLTIKNVLVKNGELTGIIDVDYVCFGDPLMFIGTTLALIEADVGEPGRFYGEELIRCWNPDPMGRLAIDFYAALWMVGIASSAEKENNPARIEQLLSLCDRILKAAETRMMAATTPTRMLDIATARHRAGEFDEAKRLYEAVLQADEQLHAAHFRLGLLEMQRGQHDVSIAHINRAIALAPNECRYVLGLGEVLCSAGRWSNATEAFRRAIQLDPGSADAHFSLAKSLLELKDTTGAKIELEATLKLDANYPAAAEKLACLR